VGRGEEPALERVTVLGHEAVEIGAVEEAFVEHEGVTGIELGADGRRLGRDLVDEVE
jgi:hypothetical protein